MDQTFWVQTLGIGFGGFLGTVARHWVNWGVRMVWPGFFPFSTLMVNVLGCFVGGGLSAYFSRNSVFSPTWVSFLTVGILGGFTTFSAFGVETVVLAEARSLSWGMANVALNLLLGIGAAWLGRSVV